MKKILLTTFFAICSLQSINAHSAITMDDCKKYYNLRDEVRPEEDPNKMENKFSVDGCDLGFNFPGFSFDVNVGSFDFCSIAKNVTGKAKDSWNNTVNNIDDWTHNSTTINPNVGENGKVGVDLNSTLNKGR